MKRTLTGIAAAAMVLGTMAPAAFAATATAAFTSGGGKTISLDGTTLYSGVQVGNATDAGTVTSYFPIWYLQQALTKGGYTNVYNPSTKTFDITMPGVTASSLTVAGGVGTGNSAISINGTVVKKFNAQWGKDFAGGKNASVTTYFPVYYLGNVLAAAGFSNAWDGNSFGFKSYVQAPFGVKAVKALNARQFEVDFTQPADQGNTFSGVTVVPQGDAAPGTLSYSLSTDGKTLTVTTTNALTPSGYYAVNVASVQDSNLNTLNPYSTTVQLTNTAAPSVVSTKAVTNTSSAVNFTLNFSEPAQFDLIKVGSVVASAVATDGTDTSYTVSVPAADALTVGQNYAVTISGLRDFGGNYATNPTTTSVTVMQDTVAPTFTISPVSPTEFKVMFNKQMNGTVPVDAVTVTDANGNYLPLASIPSYLSDGQTLDVKLAGNPIASGSTSATVNVAVKSLNDYVGNTVVAKTSAVTLAKSTVLPTITAARVVPGTTNQVQVTFNEAVNTTGTFNVTDSTGAPYVVGSVSAEDSSNHVILTLGSNLATTDTYTVALTVGTATDASGNTNPAATAKFSYTAPASASMHAQFASVYNGVSPSQSGVVADRKFKVYFDHPGAFVTSIDPTTGAYKTGAADNVANYSLDGAALPALATVSNVSSTDINNPYGIGDGSVTIDLSAVAAANLPAEFANGGQGVVTVSGVKTTAGNTVQYTSGTINVLDTTSPTVTTAYVQGDSTNGYTITLGLSEAMSAASVTEFGYGTTGTLTPFSSGSNSVSGFTVGSSHIVLSIKNATDMSAVKAALAAGPLFVGPTGSITVTKDNATTLPNVANAIADATYAANTWTGAVALTNYSGTASLTQVTSGVLLTDAAAGSIHAAVTNANAPAGTASVAIVSRTTTAYTSADIGSAITATVRAAATPVAGTTTSLVNAGTASVANYVLVAFLDASGNVIGYYTGSITMGA